MLVEALLDNRRQELLKAFVHVPLSHRRMSATIETAERPLASSGDAPRQRATPGTRRKTSTQPAFLLDLDQGSNDLICTYGGVAAGLKLKTRVNANGADGRDRRRARA